MFKFASFLAVLIKIFHENSLFNVFRKHPSYLANIERKKHHALSEWRDSQVYLSQGCFPLRKENSQMLYKGTFPVFYIFGEEDSKYATYASFFKNSYGIKGAGHNPNKTHVSELRHILNIILKYFP